MFIDLMIECWKQIFLIKKANRVRCIYSYVGEDEENWDTISLSSFDPTLCFTVMPFLSTYHVVWEYYYITILALFNGKHIFLPAEKVV